MTGSYYFILWVVIWLTGGYFLADTIPATLLALFMIALCFIIGYFSVKLTSKQIAFQGLMRDLTLMKATFEKDNKFIESHFRRQYLLNAFLCAICFAVVCYLVIQNENIAIIALISYMSIHFMRRARMGHEKLTALKWEGDPERTFNYLQHSLYDCYYNNRKEKGSHEKAIPTPSARDIWYRKCELGFSVLALLTGIALITISTPYVSLLPASVFPPQLLSAYGFVGICFGIADLISEINEHEDIPYNKEQTCQ